MYKKLKIGGQFHVSGESQAQLAKKYKLRKLEPAARI
jgi:hypothetical protein